MAKNSTMSEDELAFYDALETNDSAVKVLGDETLRDIARELVETVRGQRHHRLDPARERAGEPSSAGQAHTQEIRLSTRQAGKGNAYGDRTGGGALCWLGCVKVSLLLSCTDNCPTSVLRNGENDPPMEVVSDQYRNL